MSEDQEKPAQKAAAPSKEGGKGGMLPVILSGGMLAVSAAALAGAWFISSGGNGASAASAAPALDLASSRADTSRTLDELNFLSSLVGAVVPAEAGAAEHQLAARTYFTIANRLYDRDMKPDAEKAAAAGAASYAAAKIPDADTTDDLWLQWREANTAARAASADAAPALWKSSQAIGDKLAAIDPENAQFLRAGWMSAFKHSEAAADADDLPTADTHSLTAVDLAQKIVDLRPGQQLSERDLFNSLINRGDILVRTNDVAGAKASYDKARAMVEEAAKDAQNTRAGDDLYNVLVKLGSANTKASDWASARQNFNAALGLMNARPDADAVVKRKAVQAQARLAEVEFDAGDLAASKAMYEQVIANQQLLVDADPASAPLVRDLARYYAGFGATAVALKDDALAASIYGKAIQARAATAAIDPTSLLYQRELVAAYEKLAATTKAPADWKRAMAPADALSKLSGVSDSDQRMIKRIRDRQPK